MKKQRRPTRGKCRRRPTRNERMCKRKRISSLTNQRREERRTNEKKKERGKRSEAILLDWRLLNKVKLRFDYINIETCTQRFVRLPSSNCVCVFSNDKPKSIEQCVRKASGEEHICQLSESLTNRRRRRIFVLLTKHFNWAQLMIELTNNSTQKRSSSITSRKSVMERRDH